MTKEIIREPLDFEDEEIVIVQMLEYDIKKDIKRLTDIIGVEATKDFIKKLWE